MMLRGYIDKRQNIFTLACLISTSKEWAESERAWKIYLAGWNKRLKKLGRPPLTRYHASDCRNPEARVCWMEHGRAERTDTRAGRHFGAARCRQQPGLRILRHAVSRPSFECSYQCIAESVLLAGHPLDRAMSALLAASERRQDRATEPGRR
jgi:hypothetical protein